MEMEKNPQLKKSFIQLSPNERLFLRKGPKNSKGWQTKIT